MKLFVLSAFLLSFLPLVSLGAETCADSAKVYKICSDQKPLLDQSIEKAKKDKKSLLVVFGADWCPWCLSLNKIFHDPKLQKKLSGKYELLEIGVYAYDSKEKIPSGFAVLEQVKKLANVTQEQKGVPLLAMINPSTGKAAFIDTEPLEKNTKTTQGHDVNKVFSALEKTQATL
jgi:thioredoxin-related protein